MIELAKPKPLNSGKKKISTNKLTTVTSTKQLTQTPPSVRGRITPVGCPRRLQTENDRKLYKLSLKRAAIALNLLNQMLKKL